MSQDAHAGAAITPGLRVRHSLGAGLLHRPGRHHICGQPYFPVMRRTQEDMSDVLSSKYKRAQRRYRTWVKALQAQRSHLSIVHRDGVPDCICERSVWYFAKRKSLGHHRHCEICHPRYRNSSARSRLKHFITNTGLFPHSRQLKTFYRYAILRRLAL